MADSAPDLPDALENALAEAFLRAPGERDAKLKKLIQQNGEHAEALARRIAEMHAVYRERVPVETITVEKLRDPAASRPDSIGSYKLLDTLGQGGMGTVYLAEQREPVRRRVALKVIKLGMDSKQVVSRFELERQALAVMNHPTIAKVFEAGITEQGQPYFVMEFVEGIALTDYCDRHKLDLEERIRVFQQVCRGVQHAHQKGVVHRDLKPGNILVAQKGDEHAAKIIDFGLARATGQQLVDHSIYTEQGQLIGTPEYMSPEQASGLALGIDTRTDVYSLGVVLYELLTGELPFTSERLRQAGLLEVQKIIEEVEPEKPSTKVSSAGDAASTWAQKRRISVAALRRRLRGDLDWIVLCAMAKEPERRYGSALGLALDLGRYLEHEPVEAGPPSTAYRLSKFVRKYRAQVTAAVLVVVVAVTGAIVALQYARIAQASEAATKREKARFDRLSVVVQLEDAREELAKLQPAWPDKIAALKGWLENRGDRLEVELPEVRRILKELRDKALSLTPEQEKADREGHPHYPALLAQQQEVGTLRRAMAVRKGGAAQPAPLPADAPDDPSALNNRAWPRVTPDPNERKWGEEQLALSLARRSMQLATEHKSGKVHYYGDTLAWALFANGLDDAALAASREALAAAPAAEKKEYATNLSKLEAAIVSASQDLADAERELARLQGVVAARQTHAFDDQADTFLYQTMLRVERDLVAFLGEQGARIDAQRRLAWAERVDALTKNHPNARVTWAAVRDALRKADGVVTSELYRPKHHEDHPIDLQPQTGLVPIGMNPKTKLWEFYHLRSAYDPRTGTDPAALAIPRHAADGSIPVTETTGIVFVLLPGGTYTMGAQRTNPDGKNFDPQAESDETLSERTVAPFFLARHELTQGQWVRLSLQANPSRYFPGANIPQRVTMTHPVEQVDWSMCMALLHRHGLQLPHEAEWEYGCRGGKNTPWFPGETAADLEGFANVFDKSAKEKAPGWLGELVPFRDGYVVHAPVNAFRPNPFGLHDVHGNVSEWCLDRYDNIRIGRGGGFIDESRLARSSNRNSAAPTLRSHALGLRPARARH